MLFFFVRRMKINPRDVKNDFQLLQPDEVLLCVQLKFHAKLSFFFLEVKHDDKCEREREHQSKLRARD